MRIYIPATVPDLQNEQGVSARIVFGVTSHLRNMAPDHDEEGLEYLAFLSAADAAIDQQQVTRIVLAADAPAADELEAPGVVQVQDVPWEQVVSVHIDDLTDAGLLADIQAAQIGDEDARARVNGADLLWYDVAELAEVIRLIAAI